MTAEHPEVAEVEAMASDTPASIDGIVADEVDAHSGQTVESVED